ncbi:hypothetical protein CPC08DRAFT_761204 [Agrocybe pediades]|nr:hypothetical protein CPC08DRAFT_761204 [Agrocybe pediades]
MLSSIASFLPSALNIGGHSNHDLPRPTVNPDTEDEEDDVEEVPPQGRDDPETQRAPRGKEKDGKLANETFIFVRPPPSKTNHPLNLQVQLVPPNAKPPSGVVPSGADSTATTPTSARSHTSASSEDGASLARTTSNRSSTSASTSASINYNTSTASFASVASSTASSTTRRTIIPLYNLQAHNVMTNVIVDAGTDAKIAKFQKRGIELIDLALLEPVEVWGEKDKQGEKIARRESMRISVDEMGAMVAPIVPINAASVNSKSGLMSSRSATFNFSGRSSSRPGTPSAASSSASLHSQGQQSRRNSSVISSSTVANNGGNNTNTDAQYPRDMPVPISMPVPYPAAPGPLPPQQPKRNLFNKLFNKKDKSGATDSGSATPTQGTIGHGPSSPSFGSFSLNPAPMTNKLLNSISGNNSATDKRGRPPVLVTSSPASPSSPTSQQTTPTAPQTPRQEPPYSPTPTIAPVPREKDKDKKGHGRNISLTSAIATPFKTTLKNNRDRLSAVLNGGVNPSTSSGDLRGDAQAQAQVQAQAAALNASTSGNNLMVPGTQRPSDNRTETRKRDASPGGSGQRNGTNTTIPQSRNGHGGSRSQLSLNAAMMADHEREQQQQQFNPLMLTQSQAKEELVSLKQQQLQLRPPVLGIQPTFVSSAGPTPHIPPAVASPLVAALSPRMSSEIPENLLQGQRALMYVWLVRRWLKRQPSAFGGHANESGLFAGLGVSRSGKGASASVHSQENSSLGNNGLAYGGVEVRFEWKRAKTKDSGKGSKGRKKSRRGRAMTTTNTTDGGASDGEVERSRSVRRNRTRERDASTTAGTTDPKERVKSEEKKRNRMSTGSFSTTTASTEENSTTTAPEDDGEESDPEDSETPWVCTLKIRRAAAPGALPIPMQQQQQGDQGGKAQYLAPVIPTQVLRVKVGTLSPTPHHPKVVAMLKVPFPLPDVEVERMGIVRRKGFPLPGQGEEQEKNSGNGAEEREREEREPYHGLTLTAEEIKDMVCSTGLWLVVREGFGGVGRVSRKGDGWRIRA